MSEEQKEGWGFPANSRKAHYFIGGQSLCNRWLYTGTLEQGNDDSPDNCAACKRKLKKLKKVRSDDPKKEDTSTKTQDPSTHPLHGC